MTTTEMNAEKVDGIYMVPEFNLDHLRDQLTAVNKQADKVGAPHVTLAETGNEKFVNSRAASGRDLKLRLVEIKIEGEMPTLPGGWRLVASIDHTEALPLVFEFEGQTCPSSERERGRETCDHCNTRRKRNKTVVLRDESGAYVQIGTTCLADFIGLDKFNPDYLAKLAELISRLFDAAGEDYDDEFGFEGGGGYREYYIDVEEVCQVTAAILLDEPWVSRARSEMTDQPATADVVSNFLFPPKSFPSRERAREFAEWRAQVRSRMERTKEAGTAALEWAKDLADSEVEFELNLAALALSGNVKAKRMGLAAYIYAGHQRHLGQLREAERAAESEWIGTPGKRETFTLTYTDSHAFDGAYGTTFFLKFEDPSGNRVTWKSSNSPGDLELDKGKTYRITATVNAADKAYGPGHDTFKGHKVTNVSRGAIEWIEVGKAADLELDQDGGKWVTVCHRHGAVCNHKTKKLATDHAKDPAGWCEDCRDGEEG